MPSKRGAREKDNENENINAYENRRRALAIGAAFPLGAIAAEPTKTTTQQGVIQKVKPEKKAPRKHYTALPWMES